MTKKTLKEVTQELKDLRLQYKKLGDKVSRKHKLWEKMTEEENAKFFDDIEWLVRNPDSPGQYEALRKWMKAIYGGEYKGVCASGYTHDGNYQNKEQNFDLSLRDYEGGQKEEFKANVVSFLKEVLPLLTYTVKVSSRWGNKFPEMEVKTLKYKSESSGLSYLFYNEQEDIWYRGTLVYGSWDVTGKFNSFDEAFDYAYNKAQQEED